MPNMYGKPSYHILHRLISQQVPYEIDYLFTPPCPVVGYVVPPIVYPCGNLPLAEKGIHLAGAFQQIVLPGTLSNTHHDAAVALGIPIGVVGRHATQEIVG